jgi:hypothetical protein
MKGAELVAEIHVGSLTLADLRVEQERLLARLAAERERTEAALQRARDHILVMPRHIQQVDGDVMVQVD